MVDVDMKYKFANEYIQRIKNSMEINSIIIDSNWGNATRLIYDLNISDNDAEIILGIDHLNLHPIQTPFPFVTSLCYPNYKQILTSETSSKFLNIKSIEQYKECFIRWINTWCNTKIEIEEEFKLVDMFQILYINGYSDCERIQKQESIKNEIKEESLKRLKDRINFIENLLPK